MNMNYSEQASAATRMYRERLQAVVESTGASIQSAIAAEWILAELDSTDSHRTDKILLDDWKLFYMLHRLTEYHWVDKRTDLPHQFTFAQRAHLLNVSYHSRKWSVSSFETMLANASDKLRKS